MAATINLKQFESKDIVPLSTRAAGVYEQKLSIIGNAFLSTVYIETISAGASVLVEYFDYTTGSENGEEISLQSHPLLSSGDLSQQIIVTNFHDKPFVRCTVSGETVRFSVYGTVKNLSDLDANLTRHDADAVIQNQKGMLIGGYDSSAGKFQFLPLENDAVKVSGDIEVQAPGGLDVYPNGLRVAGRVSVVNVNANTWTALPASPLAQRNAISIQNLSGQPIKVNYSSSIGGFVGITIADQSERNYNITDTIILYAKCQTGTAQIIVEELS